MSSCSGKPCTAPLVGSANVEDNDAADKVQAILPDCGNEGECINPEDFNNVDWGNVNFDDFLQFPGFTDEPELEPNVEELLRPDTSQDIFSTLNHFDTSRTSESPASTSRKAQSQSLAMAKHISPTEQLQDLPPAQSPMPSRANSQQEEQSWFGDHKILPIPNIVPHEYAYPDPELIASNLQMSAQFPPYFDLGNQVAPINQEDFFPPCFNCEIQPTNAPGRSVEQPVGVSMPLFTHDEKNLGLVNVPTQPEGQRCEFRNKPRQHRNKSIQITKKNMKYIENHHYEPLRHAPRSWGPFVYTRNGELEPSDLFSPDQIIEYLFQHPIHRQVPSMKESKLILRIHRNPPDSANRFPTVHGSHRCRFQDCPAQNNTINQGQYAVIFDEFSVDHPDHDPFLNAGWVHLYCLERFCDFPRICALLNVQPENRVFRNERNNNKGNNCLRLDKVKGVESLVENFIQTCRKGILPDDYPRFDDRDEGGAPYEGTLCHKMCLKKQRWQPRAVNRQDVVRQQAAGYRGASLSNHLGDLAIEAPMRYSTRKHENQNQLMANPRHKRVYKHDAIENNHEDGYKSGHEDERPRKRRRQYTAPTAKMLPSGHQNQPQSLNEGLRFAMPSNTIPLSIEASPYYDNQPFNQPSFDMLRENHLQSPTALLRKRQTSRERKRDGTRTDKDYIVITSKRRRSSEFKEDISVSNVASSANTLAGTKRKRDDSTELVTSTESFPKKRGPSPPQTCIHPPPPQLLPLQQTNMTHHILPLEQEHISQPDPFPGHPGFQNVPSVQTTGRVF